MYLIRLMCSEHSTLNRKILDALDKRMHGKLLTPIEVAKGKGVSKMAVYLAISEGRLPHVRVLGRIGLREADVQKWTPAAYKGRPGTKRPGGRPKGMKMSEESRARLSAAQKQRWAERKAKEDGTALQ